MKIIRGRIIDPPVEQEAITDGAIEEHLHLADFSLTEDGYAVGDGLRFSLYDLVNEFLIQCADAHVNERETYLDELMAGVRKDVREYLEQRRDEV